ncbi:MAG: hypothetical protein QXJ72_06520, partial [Thermoproteota archaeon]
MAIWRRGFREAVGPWSAVVINIAVFTVSANFSVIADRPRTIIAGWDTEYEVKVKTDHGTASGSGWCLAGSTVTVSISTTLIEKDFFANYVFKGWVIDSEIISTSSTYS